MPLSFCNFAEEELQISFSLTPIYALHEIPARQKEVMKSNNGRTPHNIIKTPRYITKITHTLQTASVKSMNEKVIHVEPIIFRDFSSYDIIMSPLIIKINFKVT